MKFAFVRFALATLASLLVPTGLARGDETPALSVYGSIRLDVIINDSTMSDPEAPQFVVLEPDGASNAELSMHPRLTRLGLKIEPFWLGEHFEGAGMVETDFQTGLQADTRDVVRVRHAYFTVSNRFVELLAGQTWDLISPLFPSANNDSLMWNAGNTGAWRPQVRFTGTPGDRLRLAMAFGAPGAVDEQDLDGDGQLDGPASVAPVLQMLVEYRTRVWRGRIARAGVWSHVGVEQLGDDTPLSTKTIGVHLLLPIADRLTVLGELFYGVNLSDIRCGIGQGVNPATGEEISALGGWLEAAFVKSPRYMIAAGTTFDRPDPDDLENGARDLNQTFYLVQRFRPWRAFQIGAEYVHWRTRYRSTGRGAANRFNLHGTLSF